MNYGKSLDQATMASDPFYALNHVFWFVASSYRQYLNMLEKKDAERTSTSLIGSQSEGANADPEAWDSTNLRFDRSVLEKHVVHLRQIVQTIQYQGCEAHSSDKHGWPRARESAQAEVALEAAKQLERTFQLLLQQAEQILTRYRDGMNVLMNRATMAEANKSLIQAKEVAKLTKLAFVYIPLSFTASFFGMNVTPLNPAGLSDDEEEVQLWVWFVVSAPVLVISLILMRWDFSEIWRGFVHLFWSLVGRMRLPKQESVKKANDSRSEDNMSV